MGGAYDNRFRTHAHPVVSTPLVFAVLGDFGVGVRKASRPNNQQREVAAALTRAVTDSGVRLVLTTGDNIYAGKKILGIPIGATGDEDDDWFLRFISPTATSSIACRSIRRWAITTPVRSSSRTTTADNSWTTSSSVSGSITPRSPRSRPWIPACSIDSASAPISSSSAWTRRRRRPCRAIASSWIPGTFRFSMRHFAPDPRPTDPCGRFHSRTIRRTAPGLDTTTRRLSSNTWRRASSWRECGRVLRPRTQFSARSPTRCTTL